MCFSKQPTWTQPMNAPTIIFLTSNRLFVHTSWPFKCYSSSFFLNSFLKHTRLCFIIHNISCLDCHWFFIAQISRNCRLRPDSLCFVIRFLLSRTLVMMLRHYQDTSVCFLQRNSRINVMKVQICDRKFHATVP